MFGEATGFIYVVVQRSGINVALSAESVSSPTTSPSGVLRGIGVPLHSTATLLVSLFGGPPDYRQFLIWWRLSSFVMIIAEFWPVIGCRRSMALDSPSVVRAGHRALSLLNGAFPLSIHPFHPYCLFSSSMSFSPSPLSHFINSLVYISFFSQSVLTQGLFFSFRYWLYEAVESHIVDFIKELFLLCSTWLSHHWGKKKFMNSLWADSC